MGKNKKADPNRISEREWRRRRRRRALILRASCLSVVLLALLAAIWGVSAGIRRSSERRSEEKAEREAQIIAEEEALKQRKHVLAEAEVLAAGYDYDQAVELIQSIEEYDQDADLLAVAAKYSAAKSTLVTYDAGTVQHLLFRPLIVDAERAFNVSIQGQSTVDTLKSWTITLDEFNGILQEMYDRGYVFVSIHDLVDETESETGTTTMKKSSSIKLPEGKTPVILSVDDLSYYHSYENRGFADKLVLDENGDIKAQYTDANGMINVGDYDIIPIMEAFFQEHPDASYKGARGMIALTGYNGVFGYRTDASYSTGINLDGGQQQWLSRHPDFDWEKEKEEATKVADTLKDHGWEFACATWGKVNLSSASITAVQADHQKWINNVQNIVGETDILVFPYGMDMGNWKDYSEDNETYAYYKSQGFHYFCNIDTSQKAWIQIRSEYLRQGRINVDGSMLNKMLQGKSEVLKDVFDVNQICGSYRYS